MLPIRPPRRILLLFTDVYANGGIQRFNQTFIAAMTLLGVQCEVLSMHDTHASIGSRTLDPNVHATGFAGSRVRFARATMRAIWSRKYDWILIGHVNLVTLIMGALATRPLKRARTVLIAHGIEVWYGIPRTRRQALRRVDSILCVSAYTRGRVLDQVPGLPPERLKIFPNALGDTWRRAPAAAVLPRLLPQRYILSVTRLEVGDRYKGLVSVIEALSMTEDASLQYIIVGQGNDRAFLQWVAARFRVSDRVHFLSGVTDEELTGLYTRCQAFVLPSGKEGFGIVFLEAMYFGAPVIAAAEKGALDVVRDGETGLLVPFGDSIALKRAIDRICNDEVLRERLRRTGRSTVTGAGAFTFSRFVERSAEVLDIPRGASA
jgi:glycosyltransferase involved in cell wall biosynthesis